MRQFLASAVLATAVITPSIASAAVVDVSLVPDGTYVVKVEKIQDPQHAVVMMNNGVETTLVATGWVDFTKVKPNQSIKISLVKGKVPVFLAQ